MIAEHLRKYIWQDQELEGAVTEEANMEEEAGAVETGTGTEVDMEIETTKTATTETTDKDPPDLYHWKKVVELVLADFREWRMEEEYKWKAVVMTPNGDGEYHIIGLVEVVWKVVTLILNHHFTTSITFHDVLHWKMAPPL